MSNSEKNINRAIVLYSLPLLALLSIMCLIVGEPIIDIKEIWLSPYIEKGVGCLIIASSTFLWSALALMLYLAI